MTRRALLIRVLIFVPLFAFFGYGAYQKWQNERAAAQSEADAASAREAELKSATHSVKLHDGRSIDIVELTPEQAERLHGIKMPPEDKPVDAKAPPSEAKPVDVDAPAPTPDAGATN